MSRRHAPQHRQSLASLDTWVKQQAKAAEAESEREAETLAEAEPEDTAEPETAPAPKAEAEPEVNAEAETEPEVTAEDRADHYRAIAEHRDQAVEHPGRAQIEAARAAQARIDEERATEKAGEVPFNMGAQREAEAEHSPEAEAEA